MAEAEAEAGETDAAVATIDRAIAQSERTGQRWYEAESHRISGEILLKHNPCNPAPAEEAFLASIAIAQSQKARSFELRAALSLAKLYQSTGRPAEAHAVLTPALAGFSPTPEMPEVAEAQALLAGLAETDEVKSDAARRHRLTQLHAAYGNALIAAQGHGAPETMEAFARAHKSASGDEDAPGRFAADYGLWVGSFVRGDLPSMRTHAAAFLAGVAARPNSPEAGVAHRVLGTTHCFAGEYAEARKHLERALSICSNPAGTMIWPFASGKTPASRQCATWRSCHGRWETSGARYPSLRARTSDSQRGAYRHAPLYEITRGDVRIDARRQGARR